jgi:hypothetical protein
MHSLDKRGASQTEQGAKECGLARVEVFLAHVDEFFFVAPPPRPRVHSHDEESKPTAHDDAAPASRASPTSAIRADAASCSASTRRPAAVAR